MSDQITAILLLSCPDQEGIVARISYFISENNGNIIRSDQHTDIESGTYFMRIEWEIKNFLIPRDQIAAHFDPIAKKFEMQWSLHFSDEIPRVAILVSKYDHCLYEILLRQKSGEINANFCAVLSNHEDLKPVADYFDIEFIHTPVSKDTKPEDEAKQIATLKKLNVDLIILARYMQILSPKFVDEFEGKIINIHHSFLPAFVGARPYHQAHARGVKIIGATSHYVTSELDQGPIIEQDVARVDHRCSVKKLIEKGRNLEKLVLSRAVKLHLENKVLIFGNKTVVFD